MRFTDDHHGGGVVADDDPDDRIDGAVPAIESISTRRRRDILNRTATGVFVVPESTENDALSFGSTLLLILE